MKSREYFNIQKSIDNLASKFTELENAYYGFLQKSQEENENIIKKEADLSSEFFQSLLKEQTYLQNNIKHLTALEKSYNEELKHLRTMLPELREESAGVSAESLLELQKVIEYSLNNLMEGIFSTDGLERLEQKVAIKFERHFEEAFQTISQAFTDIPQVSKEHIDEILNLDKIEEIYVANAGFLDNLELGLETFKKITAISLKEIDKLSIDFTKEAQALQGNIEQGRIEVAKLAKGTKTTQKQKHSAEAETTPGLKNACTSLNQLFAEALTSDTNKNQAFVSTRAQTEEISKALRYYIKDTKKYFETLKGNNQAVKMVVDALKGQGETRTGTFPNREEEQKEARNQRPFVETRGGSGPERIGGLIGNKEGEEISDIKSPISESPWEIKDQLLENKLIQQGISSQDVEKALAHLHEMEERIGEHAIHLQQRLELLKSSYRTFIASTGKMIRFLPRKGADEELAVKACDNDKKVFEAHLKTIEEIIVQIQESIRTSVHGVKAKGKSIDIIFIEKVNNVLDAGYPEKGSAGSTKSHDHKKKGSKKGKPEHRLKPLAGNFEGEPHQKALSPTHSKGELRKSPLGNRPKEMASTNPEGGWQRTTTTSTRNQRDASPELQSLEFELVLLQKRCEELGKERDRLKKELGAMKKQPSAMDLLPKVQELTDHNDRLAKDNATLVKVAKKLDQKVEERKKNLKKLFEVLTEKEKELNFYKTQLGKVGEDKQQEERGRGRTSEKNENERHSSKEDMVSLQRKSHQISEILSQISSSPYSQVPKIKELISFLRDEGADIDEKIKLSKSSRESREVSLEKRSFRNTKEPEEHKGKTAAQNAKIQELEAEKNELEAEKNELEARCDEMMKELEVAQDLRSKLEKNYRDEVAVLNDKVRQLNEYIEDMEAKNNERLRNSNEKWKKNASSDRPVSSTPDREIEKAAIIDQLQNDIKALEERLEQFLESLGVENDDYQNIDIFGKLEVLYEAFQVRVEEIVKEQEEAHEEANKEKGPSVEDMEEIRKKCTELEALIDSYQTELNEKDADNKEMADLLVARDNEIERLNGELQAKTEENNGYAEEIKSFEETLEKIGEEYQSHLEKLANTLANYGLPIDTTETDFAKFGEQLVNLIDSTLEVVANMREEEEKNKGKAAGKAAGEQQGEEDQAADIQELEQANVELAEAVEALKEQLDIREKEMDELLEEREQNEQGIELLKKNFEEMDNEFKKLRKENKQLKEEKDKLESENKGTGPREVTHEQEAEIASLKELIAEKNANISELKKALEEKEKVLGMMRGSVGLGGGEGEAKKLKGILQEKEGLIQQKDKEITEKMELKEKELKEVKSKLNKRIDEINSKFWKETEQYNLKIQNLTKQIGKLKENLQTVNSELVESREQKEKAEQAREELEKALEVKELEIEELQYTFEQEKEQIQAQYDGQNEQLTQGEKTQLEDLKKELVKKEKIIAQLKEQKLSIQEELSGLYKEYEELEKQVTELKEEKSALETELQEAKEELIKAQAHIDELVHQNEGLEEDLIEAKTEVTGAQNEIKKLIREKLETESQLEEFKEKLEDEQRYVEELAGEHDEIKEKLAQTIDQLNEVQKKNRESGKIIKQLEEDKLALERGLEERTRELEHIKETQESMSTSVSSMHVNHDELISQIKQRTAEIADKDEKIKDLEEQVAQIERALDTHQDEVIKKEKVIEELRTSIHTLTSTNKSLEGNLRNLEQLMLQEKDYNNKRIEDLMEERGSLKEQLEDAKGKLKAHEKNMEDKHSEMERHSHRSEIREREAEDVITQQEREIETLRLDILHEREVSLELGVEKKRLEDEIVRLEGENKVLVEEKEGLGEKLEELETAQYEIASLEEELAKAKEEADQYVEELENLKAQVEEYDAENQRLGQFVEEAKEAIQGLQETIGETEKELEEKTKELDEARTRIIQLEEDLQEAQGELLMFKETVKKEGEEEEDLKSLVYHNEKMLEQKTVMVQGLSKEIESYREQLEAREAELLEAHDVIKELEAELEDARKGVQQELQQEGEGVIRESDIEVDLLGGYTEEEERQLSKGVHHEGVKGDVEEQKEEKEAREIEDMKESIVMFEAKVQESRERVEVLEEEREILINKNKELKEAVVKLEREVFDLKEELEGKDMEIEEKAYELEQKYETESENLRVSITRLEAKVAENKERISLLEEERDGAIKEVSELKEAIVVKERELFDLKIAKEEEVEEKDQDLVQENEKLRSSIAAFEAKIAELRERIFITETERDEAIGENYVSQDKLNQKERELFNYKAEKEQELLAKDQEIQHGWGQENEGLKLSVAALETKLHELRETASVLESERDEVLFDNNAIRDKNLADERQIFDLKAELELKEQELKESKHALEHKTSQENEDLKASIVAFEAKLAHAHERIGVLETERDEAINENNILQDNLEAKEREIFDLKVEKEEELLEKDEEIQHGLVEENENLKSSIAACEAKLAELRERISILETERDEAIQENSEIKDHFDTKVREILDLRDQQEKDILNEKEEVEKRLGQEIENLQISFAAAEEKLHEARERITALESERDAAVRETEKVAQYERELFDAKALAQELQESKESTETGLVLALENLNVHISLTETKLHEANARVIALEQERDDVLRQSDEIREALTNKERELFDMKVALEEKEQELHESKEAHEKKSSQENEDLKTSVTALEAKLAHIHEQIRVLESQRDEAIHENHSIKDTLDAKEREIFDLKAELELVKTETEHKTVEEHENLKTSLTALEEKVTHNKERVGVLETERDEAIKENAELRAIIELKEGELSAIRAVIVQLESEIGEKSIVSHEEQHTESVESYVGRVVRARFESKQTEINELLEHLKKRNEEITEKENRIAELEKELGEVKAQNHNLLVEVEADDDELSTMRAVLTEREEEIALYKTKLTEKSEEITRVNERIGELEKERDSARAEREEIRTKYIRLEEESSEALVQKDQELLNSQVEYMKTSSTELTELRTKFESSEAELEKLKVHLSDVEKELNTEREHNVSLKKEFEEKQAAIQGYEKEISETKLSMAHKETELAAVQTSIIALEKEREEHSALKESAHLAEKEKSELVARLKELDDIHSQEKANLERNMEELEEKVQTYEKEINISKIRAAETQKELDKAQKEISSLKEIVQQKDSQLVLNSSEKKDQQEVEMLRAERDMLQREIEVREEQYNVNMKELNDGVAEISAALKEKEQEIEALTAKLLEHPRKSNSEKKRHTSPNDKSPAPFGHDFEDFEDQFDQFEDFEDSFNESFKKTKASNVLNQSVKELQEKNDRLEKEKINVLQQLEQSKETETTLRTQLEKLSPTKPQFESKETREEETGRLELLEKEITELTAIISMKDAEIADTRTKGAVQIEKVRMEYRGELDEANEENMALRDRNGEILAELEQLQANYNTSKNSVNILKLENDRLQNDVKSLNIRLETVNAELKDLKEKEGYLNIQLKGMGERSPTRELSPVGKHDLGVEKVSSTEDFTNINDPEVLKKKLVDYERKFEKLRTERRTIKETTNSLKDENKELRQNVLMFQQQIVMLSQSGTQGGNIGSQKDTGVAEALRESLKSLQGLKAFSGRFDFKVEDGAEVRKIMGVVKETLEANEKEILRLNNIEKELINTVESYKDSIVHKLSSLKNEILDVVADAGLEVPAINQRLLAHNELTQDEKVIYSALNLLRRYHDEVVEEINSLQQSPTKEPNERKTAKSKDERISQAPSSNVKGTPMKKGESYEEEVKESPFKPTPSKPQKQDSYRDQHSLSSPDDFDDAKARSFIEEETLEVANKLHTEVEEPNEVLSEERHQIQGLYQQVRKLQDDNDRLDSEYRQLKNDYDILKFLCDDLKAELAEKDERIAKLLENIMTNEAGNAGSINLEQSAVHEKEHLRKIFLKFLDSALQGSKDAEDLFKVLLTLLQVPEEDKNYIIQGFKSKSKKGMFSKMFK